MSSKKIELWSCIEDHIVLNAKNRSEAYKQLHLEGYKRTQNAVWAKYRKLKRNLK